MWCKEGKMKKKQVVKPWTISEIATEADCQLFVKYRPEKSAEEVGKEMADRRKMERLRRSRRFDFLGYVTSLIFRRKSKAATSP